MTGENVCLPLHVHLESTYHLSPCIVCVPWLSFLFGTAHKCHRPYLFCRSWEAAGPESERVKLRSWEWRDRNDRSIPKFHSCRHHQIPWHWNAGKQTCSPFLRVKVCMSLIILLLPCCAVDYLVFSFYFHMLSEAPSHVSHVRGSF